MGAVLKGSTYVMKNVHVQKCTFRVYYYMYFFLKPLSCHKVGLLSGLCCAFSKHSISTTARQSSNSTIKRIDQGTHKFLGETVYPLMQTI
jgi:hypothetical protein